MFAGCWQIILAHWHLIRVEGIGYSQIIRAENLDVCRSCDLCLQAATPTLPQTEPADVKSKPKVTIAGQVSVYWFCNNRGLPYDKNSLHKLGMQAGARCQELGIVMGVKFQQEIRPDRSKFQGRVRTYPLEVLESLMTGENAPIPGSTRYSGAEQ